MSRLKKLMKDAGISQIELASRLGVHDSSVSKWVNWEIPIPKRHKTQLCQILKVDMKALESEVNNEN